MASVLSFPHLCCFRFCFSRQSDRGVHHRYPVDGRNKYGCRQSDGQGAGDRSADIVDSHHFTGGAECAERRGNRSGAAEMNIRALILIVGVGWNSVALAECDSSPKPVEDAQSISSGTLVLKASGSYYLIDACVRISRSQFGTIVALGYLNNFSQSTTPTFYSVKATRTLQGNNHPLLSLVRSPSWYLAASQQSGIQEAPEIRGMPYRGTLSQWNQ